MNTWATEAFKHGLIPCRVSPGFYGGPRARGRKILDAVPEGTPVLPPRMFMDSLQRLFLPHMQHVEQVTFKSFNHDGRHYPVAVCHTAPVFKSRQVFFDEAQTLADCTGWYLMVTGSLYKSTRLEKKPAYQRYQPYRTQHAQVNWGAVQGVQNVSTDDGTALLLKFKRFSLNLDVGFEGPRVVGDLAVVSHSHMDHAGGLQAYLAKGGQAVLSEAALHVLERMHSSLRNHPRVMIADLKDTLTSKEGHRVDFFPGFHTHDALITRIRGKDFEVVYSGDHCDHNSYHQGGNKFLLNLFEGKARQLLLLDACFLNIHDRTGRPIQQVMKQIRNHLEDDKRVVVASKTPDHLYPLYLYFFAQHNSGQNNLRAPMFISEDLFEHLRIGYRNSRTKSGQPLDWFSRNILKNSEVSYLESAMLYDLESLPDSHLQRSHIVFTTPSQLHHLPPFPGETIAYTTGNHLDPVTMQLHSRLKRVSGQSTKLKGSDHAMHSAHASTVELLFQAAEWNIRVGMFHTSPGNVKAFLREYPELDRWVCHVNDLS